MKLAFVSNADPFDPGTWAGIPSFLCRTLGAAGVEVHHVRPRDATLLPGQILHRLGYNFLLRGRKGIYADSLHPPSIKDQCRRAGRMIREVKPDVVLSTFPLEIPFLDAPCPVVLWTDATFDLLNRTYDWYKDLCKVSVRNGHALEQAGILRHARLVYSNQWAADSALGTYGADPSKVRVINYGANVDPPYTEMPDFAALKPFDNCRLLFVGGDPRRKGLDKALAVVKELNGLGIPTQLTVIGPQERPAELPPHTVWLGRISKATPEGRRTIHRAYQEAHFFILPTKAEACAVVLAEASAYGVPSVTHEVGGLRSIVTPERNGLLFQASSPAAEMSGEIARYWRNPERYLKFCESVYQEYTNRIDWHIGVSKLVLEIQSLLVGNRSRGQRRGD